MKFDATLQFVARSVSMKKGLLHLDADDAIGFSSPYKGTAENPIASKKPHTMQKSAETIGGFRP
jgi:hypothetical protein